MQLIINGSTVDFELDHEKYLGQMVLSLINILKTQGHHHIKVHVNDQYIDLEADKWHDYPLESITQIQVNSSIVMELEECLSGIKKLLLGLETLGAIDHCLLAMWGNSIESIIFWLMDYKLGDDYFDPLRALSVKKLASQGVKEATITLLSKCLCMLEEKDRELDDPLKELKVATALLKGTKESLETISTLFLRGSDQKAIKSIVPFIESVEKLRRCNFFLDDGYAALKKQLSDFITEIDKNILIFSEACEKKDYILAGDIAEYEIAERLIMLDGLNYPAIKKVRDDTIALI